MLTQSLKSFHTSKEIRQAVDSFQSAVEQEKADRNAKYRLIPLRNQPTILSPDSSIWKHVPTSLVIKLANPKNKPDEGSLYFLCNAYSQNTNVLITVFVGWHP